MTERFAQGKLRWINMKRPTPAEIHKIMLELELPPVLMGDLSSAVPKNSVCRADDTLKLTLDFPAVKNISPEHQLEVKFFVTRDTLLTVHYEEMEGIDRFKRQLELTSTLRKRQVHLSGAHLFIALFNNLYDATSSKLDYLESKLSDIETEIFYDNEKKLVFDIAQISKVLISFRHVMRSHEDILHDLTPLFTDLFGSSFKRDLENLGDHYDSLARRLATVYETMTALRETNIAMLETKQNEIMKIFTILAFTTFPLTLLSSLFGMNTDSTPIVGLRGDFWIIIGVMVLATISFFVYFRHKGWM
ncbi:MAG TPA: magnesium transporter CorA family protein [Candidatus Paceibacterota bacterium]|nr:magnesium transporter CorA family protein [Candidatus Paceibacterota bacterium]